MVILWKESLMDAEGEPLFIVRALLPEEIDEGTKLKYEMLQYEII